MVAIAMTKNVDLTNEECEVSFINGVKVLPSYVDPMDHVVYIVIPADAASGILRVTTKGGIAESVREFTVTEE